MAPKTKPIHFRAHLRRLVGSNGERLHEILYEIAQGNPWTPVTEDGLRMEPVAPTGDVRLRATIYLHEALFGKAVSQREQFEAEHEAQETASVAALDDATLLREIKGMLDSGEIEDAILPEPAALPEPAVKLPSTLQEWGALIFTANTDEDDEPSE